MARAALLLVLVPVAACAREPRRLEIRASVASDPGPGTRRDGRLAPASAAPVAHLAAGAHHACAVHADGAVSCWGTNRTGQITDHITARTAVRSTYAAAIPAPVAAPVRDALEVAADAERTCARRADGVWCWGSPVGAAERIAGTAHAVQITRDCARDAAGQVACWGDLLVADPVPELAGAIDLAETNRVTCALKATGAIACWSPTDDGPDREFTRKAERTLRGAVEIAIGDRARMCARQDDGSVWCWSTEMYYYSGDVPAEPTPVEGITHAVGLAVGRSFGCALERDRSVRCWGWLPGARERADVATRVPGILADELVAGDTFVCARDGGDVWCWGDNTLGELGIGWSAIHPAPITVPGIDDAVAVHAGVEYTCVRRRGGEVSCWGRSGSDLTGGATPRDVPAARGAVELAGGTDLCARFATGEVRCGPQDRLRLRARDAVAVSQSSTHAAVVRADGTIQSWGQDYFGQLGTGTTRGVENARGVAKGVADAIAVAAGDHTTCFVRRDRTVACMGRQLGFADTRLDLKPAPVPGVDHAVAVVIAERTGCALIEGGTVRCWGGGMQGQLGRAEQGDSVQAMPIPGLTDVVELAGTRGAICALRRDHALACWGLNWNGELAEPARVDWSERPITVLSDVVDVSASQHICAVRTAGTVTCWGLASVGEVSTEASGLSARPRRVAFPRELR